VVRRADLQALQVARGHAPGKALILIRPPGTEPGLLPAHPARPAGNDLPCFRTNSSLRLAPLLLASIVPCGTGSCASFTPSRAR
jgi:hypothetical protein